MIDTIIKRLFAEKLEIILENQGLPILPAIILNGKNANVWKANSSTFFTGIVEALLQNLCGMNKY